MRRISLALLLTITTIACGEKLPVPAAPTAPTTPVVLAPVITPRAQLTAFGNFRWADCVSSTTPSCTFIATLRNTGSGCAIRVEGTVRFFSASGFQTGLVYRFVLPPQQIVQAGELVPYYVAFVPVTVGQIASDYLVTPLWIDTPCV